MPILRGVLLASVTPLAGWAADLPLRHTTEPMMTAPAVNPYQWFAKLGIGAVILDESATMAVAGLPLAGASVQVDPQITGIFEIGYHFTPNIAVSYTGGLPPTIDVMGAGTIGGLGLLGEATYGPMTLTAHWHFTELGRIRPYIGAGVAYMHIFNARDGLLQNLRIENTFGPAIQVGVNIDVTDRWGVFLDVKKAWLRTDATGTLGGLPVTARVVVDPLVVSSGVTFRF